MIRKHRNRGYKFTEKTHSKIGIAAMVLALVLLALYAIFIYIAFCSDGSLSAYFGSAGVLAMLVSVVDIILAIQSMREEDSFQLFPRLGFALALLSVVCWIGTYVLGAQI